MSLIPSFSQQLSRLFFRLTFSGGSLRRTLFLVFFHLMASCTSAFYFSLALGGYLFHVDSSYLPVAFLLSAFLGFATNRLLDYLQAQMLALRFLARVLAAVCLSLVVASLWWWAVDARLWQPEPLMWGLFLTSLPLRQVLERCNSELIDCLLPSEHRKHHSRQSTRFASLSFSIFSLTIAGVVYLQPESLVWFLPLATLSVGFGLSALPLTRRLLNHVAASQDGQQQTWWQGSEKNATYYQLIFLLSLCSMFSYYVADYVLLSNAAVRFTDLHRLVCFAGLLFAALNLCEQAIQVFSLRSLEARFGLSAGLVFLPVISIPLYSMPLLLGLSGLEGGIFLFSLALARVIDLALRHTLFNRSYNLIFEPLPREIGAAMKRRFAGPIKLLILLLTTLGLFLMSRSEFSNNLMITWLLFALVLALGAALFLVRRFRDFIRQALDRDIDLTTIDTPARILARELDNASSDEVGYALNVLEHVDLDLLETYLPLLLKHEDILVRLSALERIDTLQLFSLLDSVGHISRVDPDESVRTMARFLFESLEKTLQEIPQPEELAQLAISDYLSDRQRCARLVYLTPADKAVPIINKLMWDPEPSVRRLASISAGRTGLPVFWPRLIDLLSHGMYYKSAATGLIAVGEAVLESELNSQTFKSVDTRVRIIKVQERIGGQRATRSLFAMITDPNRKVRRQALHSLTWLGYQAWPEQHALIRAQIEHCVDQITWNLAAQCDLSNAPRSQPLIAALKMENEERFAILFMLLGLIYDKQIMEMIRHHVCGLGSNHVFVIEVAQEIFPPDLNPLLLPLCERMPPEHQLQRLKLFCPRSKRGILGRLYDILGQSPELVCPWTRALAVAMLGRLEMKTIPNSLVSLIFSDQPMEREVAARLIRKRDPDFYRALLRRYDSDTANELANLLPPEGGQNGLLQFEMVPLLGACDLFRSIPLHVLAEMATRVEVCDLMPGEILFHKYDKGDAMFIVIEGSIRLHDGQKTLFHMGPGSFLGEIAVVEMGQRSLDASASEPCRLLSLDRDCLFEFMADYLQVIPPIARVIAERRAKG